MVRIGIKQGKFIFAGPEESGHQLGLIVNY